MAAWLSGLRVGAPSPAGFSAAAPAGSAVAPLPKARAASASSTLEAGAVTPRPAFWRTARASFEVIPRSFAISWTRFFAIPELSLWSPVGLLPAPETSVRAGVPRSMSRHTPAGRTRKHRGQRSGRWDPVRRHRHRRARVGVGRPWRGSAGKRRSDEAALRLLRLLRAGGIRLCGLLLDGRLAAGGVIGRRLPRAILIQRRLGGPGPICRRLGLHDLVN